ncbi:MAG: hypothetical protein JXA03_15790, partial [Bacteroidales bacterium]|nr:hypothetical protein [Bacteroidales bacterium]
MKTNFFFLFAIIAVGFASKAQTPVVSWRFANVQVIPGDSLRFDVQLKCSMAGTFHSATQIYFNYNTLAFGENIAGYPPNHNDAKIRLEMLELLHGELGGAPTYHIVNYANNKPYRFAVIQEANFVVPNPMFMNEVDTNWLGLLRFTIAIADPAQNAGIQFVPVDNQIGLMNGGQYYVDAAHPTETKYGNPPEYWGIYENDLMDYPLTHSTLDLRVFLEGPFNSSSGTMDTWLYANNLIPMSQPYDPPLPYFGNMDPLWYYTGTESVASMPVDVVDWIVLELRDAPDAAAAVSAATFATKALFLLSDGSVTDMDGLSFPFFIEPVTNGLFAVVYHRNHLPVMNSAPIPVINGMYSWDYTTGADKVYGGSLGYKEITPGIWGMIAADGNADGQVNASDKNEVWIPLSGM